MKFKIALGLTALALTLTALQGCTPAVVGGGAAVGASVAHDRRTAGSTVEDQNIEIKALHRRLQYKELRDGTNVSATSYNMVVLLTGQAASADLRDRYVDMVRKIQGVRRVVDEIEIRQPTSLTERSGDSYLTAKVKVELFNIKLPEFDPTRIKVVTERSVVYLMGLVTQQEADTVVEKVRHVSGVQKVVKVFEYVDGNG